ncbi:hypothetical protein HAX54_008875, partial [Datura stramonium]|nr:hypothetical protein [Datura stramonium]
TPYSLGYESQPSIANFTFGNNYNMPGKSSFTNGMNSNVPGKGHLSQYQKYMEKVQSDSDTRSGSTAERNIKQLLQGCTFTKEQYDQIMQMLDKRDNNADHHASNETNTA